MSGWPDKPCTCHPDDKPPVPCARGCALSLCRHIAAEKAAAYRRGQEAMRAKAAQVLLTFDPKDKALRERAWHAIRALPVEEMRHDEG